jgi:hypothetical protein
MNATTCTACQRLASIGIKCNAHRSESTSARLIREAQTLGFDSTSTDWTTRALEAEQFLGAHPVVIN